MGAYLLQQESDLFGERAYPTLNACVFGSLLVIACSSEANEDRSVELPQTGDDPSAVSDKGADQGAGTAGQDVNGDGDDGSRLEPRAIDDSDNPQRAENLQQRLSASGVEFSKTVLLSALLIPVLVSPSPP